MSQNTLQLRNPSLTEVKNWKRKSQWVTVTDTFQQVEELKGEVPVAAICLNAEILATVTEYFTPCEVFDLENEILKNKDPSGWYEK